MLENVQIPIKWKFMENRWEYPYLFHSWILRDFSCDSLRSRYQRNLKASVRGSDFIFDPVQIMYYKCHERDFSRGGILVLQTG